VFTAGPHGVDVPIEYGWVHDTMLPGGCWQIAPPVLLERLAAHRDPADSLVLVPRREMAWSNSIRYAGAGDEAVVRLHPHDAAAAGVRNDELVEVATANGSITATVRIDAGVRAGVASVTHGRAAGGPGVLTSSTDGVDPLTTMPHASGVPVVVRPAHTAATQAG
jgi:anaerobic selenocysteine-containing dehydrogenase